MTDTTLSIDDARQQLHDIIRKDVPFDDKARDAVELATQCLGVDNGHLTRIDQETDYWEAVITTDTSDGQTPPDLERDLQETYCRQTIEGDTPLALYDAPDQGWADDPAFETRKFHTYLGVPLIVDNEPYGTVCFVAEEPRSEPFSDTETQFAEHLTRLLEREFEREQVEAKLTAQTNFATVLNRVLRHNLRNDISVIRGRTELIAEQLDDEPSVETVLSHIDDLIDLSEKARDLEEVITASSERRYTEIGSLIEEIVEPFAQNYPAASISVEYDEEIHLDVLQNFDRAVEELIENAIKHSGDSPTVSVAVDRVPNAVEIQISDDGPGLPDNEAEVLERGAETPLTHGSGVGLWMAHWIVTSHEGSLDPVVTENGTTLTITLPRKPAVGVQQQLTELTRSRDKYKATFEEATDAITFVNDSGRIIEANSAAETVFGMESEKLVGRSLTEFLPDEFEFDIEWQDFQQAGDERDTETVIRADGEERVLEYSAIADIVPGQHLFISRDITERRERERELELAENVFETTQDALFLVDVEDEREYRLKRVNEAFEALTQRTSANIIGMSPREMLGDEAGPEVRSWFDECVTSQNMTQFEQEIPVDGGSRIWQVKLTPRIQDGEVKQLVGAMRNITERKERERRYNAIFNQTYQFTGLLDPDGTILEANESVLDFGDLDREDVVGKPLWEAEWWQGDEATQQEVREAVNHAAEDEFVRSEIELQGGDETAIIDFSIRPITDEQDNVRLLIPEGRDISERKEREQELRQVERRLSVALDAADAGVWEWDIESGEIVWDETMERILGLEPGAFEGTFDAFFDRIHPDDTEKLEANIKAAIEEGGTAQWEIRIAHEDGGFRWIDTRVQVITDQDGASTRIIGAGIDITERKEHERELSMLKERYETLLEAAPDPVFVADGETGEVIEVNDAAETLLGMSSDELIGSHQSELHPPDQADLYQQLFEEHVQAEGTRRRLSDGSPIYMITDNGGHVPVEISVNTVSLPDGPVTYGVFRDISERPERDKE